MFWGSLPLLPLALVIVSVFGFLLSWPLENKSLKFVTVPDGAGGGQGSEHRSSKLTETL